MKRILVLLPLCLLAQNQYGFLGGITLHQYRTEVAQFRPGVGLAFMGTTKFAIAPKWKLLPEFGYFLSHSRGLGDSTLFYSIYSGQPINPKKISVYTHFLCFGLATEYHFEEEEKFGIALGLQALYLLGQHLMVEYVPFGDTTTIQEWQKNPIEYVQRVIPRWVLNLQWQVIIALWRSERWWFYVQGIHQVNRWLYPAGAVLGVKYYFSGR